MTESIRRGFFLHGRTLHAMTVTRGTGSRKAIIETAHHPPRVVYMNKEGQSVNPLTGRTVEPNDSWAHIPW